MTVTFLIDRKSKVKIGKINFTGNEHRDLILELPYEEAQERREEILGALYKIINPLTSPLLGFMGEEIMF